MNSSGTFGFDQQWYEIWMKQSTQFFESANTHLSELFSQPDTVKPDQYSQQIQQWLDGLKQQWSFTASSAQPFHQPYATMLKNMCEQAVDLMMTEWQQRAQSSNPVNNIRELYDLWLDCCQKEYKKSLHTLSVQDAYSDMLNSALKIWKSTVPH